MSEVISEGLRSLPVDTEWVVRQSNRGAEKLLGELLPSPTVLELPPEFKYTRPDGRQVDDRAVVRDYDLILGCSKVVVFHLEKSTTQRFADQAAYHSHIRIITPEEAT